MPRIFISYRRDDAATEAGRMADLLQERLGDHVFFDRESIDPGVDYPTVIENDLAQADCLFAVIGKNWTTAANPKGERRLDDPNDYVRLEIATALKRNIRVVPVLVCGATMPGINDLPEVLARLSRCNAVQIREDSFRRDVDALVEKVSRRRLLVRRPAVWLAVGAAGVLLALVLIQQISRPTEPSDFKLKLRILVSDKFGPVDKPPEMK